jgi:hypothetical protein
VEERAEKIILTYIAIDLGVAVASGMVISKYGPTQRQCLRQRFASSIRARLEAIFATAPHQRKTVVSTLNLH